MPVEAIIVWLAYGVLAFVTGGIAMWKTEKTGVRRWGACGKVLCLGYGYTGEEIGKAQEEEVNK